MSSKKKQLLFLINPISGIGKKNIIPALINKAIDPEKFVCEIRHTEYRQHAHEIARSEHPNFDAIIAVGGDGSVNEVGSALIHTNCALGVIPGGSGNGLARHVGVPMDHEKALQRINRFEKTKIDTGSVNDHIFLGTCGFGFDAHIAQKFDEYHKRGFASYIRLVIREYRKYLPTNLKVTTDTHTSQYSALMCSVANSSQFGNGFTICPQSVIDDGKFELIFLQKFPLYKAPLIAWRFFRRTIDKSRYFSFVSFHDHVTIQCMKELPFHADGEPLGKAESFHVTLSSRSLIMI